MEKVLDNVAVKEQEIVTQETKNQEKQKPTQKQVWKSILDWSLPCLVTLGIVWLSMIICGVFPFGGNVPGYIDYSSGLVPAYTHLWDLFHGNANLFADFALGGGTNVFASYAYFLLSPIDWLINIFLRESIAWTLSYIIVIKLCLMALTSYWLFRKCFKNVNKYMSLVMSVLWAFSGWCLITYTNVGWLYIMILLPFFVYSLQVLRTEGKIWPFVLVLTWMLFLSYYITYMALVGLVVCSFIYVFCVEEKSNYKKVASRLFFGTIISILISFVIFIPSCLTSLGAHRFSAEGVSTFDIGYFTNFFSKLCVICFYSLPIYLFIKLCTKYKQDKKNILCFILCLSVMCVGIFIEPINMMWHTGSYFCWPFRYSYLIIFVLLLAGMYYLNKFTEPNSFFQENSKPIKLDKFAKYFMIITCAVLLVVMCYVQSFGKTAHPYRPIDIVAFLAYVIILLLGLGLLMFGQRSGKRWVSITLLIVVCFTQVFCYNLKFFTYTGYDSNIEIENVLAVDVSSLDKTYRLKDKEELYYENMPLISKQGSTGTWIHISSENQYQTHHRLGYDSFSTSLQSAGGTYFSDILLGYRYVLSEENLNTTLYTKIDEFNYIYKEVEDEEEGKYNYKDKTVYLYEYNITLPYLQVFESDQILGNVDKSGFEMQNFVYKTMFGQTNDLLKTIEPTNVSAQDEQGFYEITLENAVLSQIYVFGDVEYEMKLGDKELTSFDGAIFDLGSFDSDVVLKVKDFDATKLKFAKIEFSDILSLSSLASTNVFDYKTQGNTILIDYQNTSNSTYLFVPLTLLDNYEVTLNGQKAEAQKALNGYVAISLVDGENKIEIKFVPKYVKICALVTLCALLLFFAFFFINRKWHISQNNVVMWIGTVGALLIVAVVAFLVFLKPLFNFVIGIFK